MAKKNNRSQIKFTRTKFGIKLMFFEDLQGQPQVTLMFILIFGVYQNIINEHNHK